MADISLWLNEVSGKVPGATKEDIDSIVRSVIRDFCVKTRLYVRELDPISIVDGTVTYTLVSLTDTAIIGVERCEINGTPVTPESEDLLNRSTSAWRQEESEQATGIMVDSEKVLRLRQIPTEDITDGIVVWASLKPSPTTDTIPDFIYEDWYDCILWGALARLFKTPSQTWTNINLGAFYDKEYKGEWSKAKGDKITGKARMSLRVQAPPFSNIG